MTRAVINMPARAKRGQVIEIKTLVGHPMETGFRRTSVGAAIPRDIITQFVCTYNGAEICRADFYAAVSANPLFTFTTVAAETGTLEFRWSGDNNFVFTESAAITVD